VAFFTFLFTVCHLPAQTPLPVETPENWLLAFVDVETTGLRPGYHEMIDIGVVMTDLEGNEKGRFFKRIMPDHPERLSEGAAEVNGFSADRWQTLGPLSSQAVVDSLVHFHRSLANGRNVLMVAFNSHFDASFLHHLFQNAGKNWRDLYFYFILDIPSMAWSLGMRHLVGDDLSKALGIPDEPRTANEHTGITGADLNYRIYRELLKRRSSR
jgi:DNA polymerase III epsilon subunit-like protein